MSLVSGTRYSTEITSRKNIIINGNMDIWQRGTSFAAAAAGTFAPDRFAYNKTGGVTAVHTVSQSSDVPTFDESGLESNYSMLIDCTTAQASPAAADVVMIRHRIEGYDFVLLKGNNVTLSFWVKATKTGTYCISFENGAENRAYVSEYVVDISNTWEKKSITVPLTEATGVWDTTDGTGLEVWFTLMCGTTFQSTADSWLTGAFLATANQVNACDSTANNFQLAQIQLEQGTVVTEFEKRHYADELALCQRYFERFDATSGEISLLAGYANTTSNFRGVLLYSVQKRSTPTASISSTDGLLFYYRAAIITSTTVSFTPNKYATYISAAGTPLDIGDGGHINLRGGRTLDIDAEL